MDPVKQQQKMSSVTQCANSGLANKSQMCCMPIRNPNPNPYLHPPPFTVGHKSLDLSNMNIISMNTGLHIW